MKKASLSNTVLVALGVLSWTATAAGFFKLAVGNSDLSISTVGIGLVAATFSAAIQILMILFFFRAAQPAQISPTRWLFAMGCVACMLTSVTLGISSYSKWLNVHEAQLAASINDDYAAVQQQDSAVRTELEGQLRAWSLVRSEIQGIAVAEGSGTSQCQTICVFYEGYLTQVDGVLASLEADLASVQSSWNAVVQLPELEKGSALREHQNLLMNIVAANHGQSATSRAEEILSDERYTRSSNSVGIRTRAGQFLAQLEAITSMDTKMPEISGLASQAATGPVAEVEAALAIVGNVMTGNFSAIDGKEKGALLLAIMVDIFIVLVMIWQVQEKPRTEETYLGIVDTYGDSVAPLDRMAQNAGFDGAVEAVNAIEAHGHGALGMPNLFGQIVAVPVPRTSNKLNDLMVNLKNAGMATLLPLRRNKDADEQKEERLYWVSKASWRELQAIKTVVVSTPTLSSDMTFGEFVDWVCGLPDSAGFSGNTKTIRNTIARNFPFAWSLNLNELTHQRVEDLIDGFERTATVSEGTKKRYRRIFQDMLGLAAHKGLLPSERPVRSLSVVA